MVDSVHRSRLLRNCRALCSSDLIKAAISSIDKAGSGQNTTFRKQLKPGAKPGQLLQLLFYFLVLYFLLCEADTGQTES